MSTRPAFPAEESETSEMETSQDRNGPMSLFDLAQRFAAVFEASLQSLQERMQAFQMDRVRPQAEAGKHHHAARSPAAARDLSLYQGFNDPLQPGGTAAG